MAQAIAKSQINLLPPEIAARRGTRRKGVLGGGAVLLVFVVLVVAYFVSVTQIQQAERDLEKVRAQVAQMNQAVSRYQVYEQRRTLLEQRKGLLSSAQTGEISWSDFLTRFSMAIPAEVWLTSLSVTAEGATGSGNAPSYESVATTMVRLATVKGVQDVTLSSTSGSPEKGEIQFSFSLTLAGAGGASGAGAPAGGGS